MSYTSTSIQYLREQNINAVMDYFGNDNGKVLKYNPDDNEYYVHQSKEIVKLEKYDYILKYSDGSYYIYK